MRVRPETTRRTASHLPPSPALRSQGKPPLLNTSFRAAPVIRPENAGTGESPQAVPAETGGESQPGAEEILLDLLSAAPPEGIPVAEIITETGMSRRWVFYRLKQLAAAGLAVQVSRGYWRAAL